MGSANTLEPNVSSWCQYIGKAWIKTYVKELQKIYVIWFIFGILGKSFLRFLNLSSFPSLHPVLPNIKIIWFWFETMKNDWLWRKVLKTYITILNVSFDIRRNFFVQLVSVFEKLDSKFKSFFNEQLKIP